MHNAAPNCQALPRTQKSFGSVLPMYKRRPKCPTRTPPILNWTAASIAPHSLGVATPAPPRELPHRLPAAVPLLRRRGRAAPAEGRVRGRDPRGARDLVQHLDHGPRASLLRVCSLEFVYVGFLVICMVSLVTPPHQGEPLLRSSADMVAWFLGCGVSMLHDKPPLFLTPRCWTRSRGRSAASRTR